MGLREIRFGVSTGGAASRAEWQERARRVEALGYDILLTADHLVDDAFPPLLPLVSAADVTERLRVGTYVVNNDFRHPVLLAREAAALGLLTDGRFVLGLGAGHMRSEYDEAGIPFDGGAVRVDRLEESVAIVRGAARRRGGDALGRALHGHRAHGVAHRATGAAADRRQRSPGARPRGPFRRRGRVRRVQPQPRRDRGAPHPLHRGRPRRAGRMGPRAGRRSVRRPRAHRARADRRRSRRPTDRGRGDRRAPGAAHRRPGARLALPVPRHRPADRRAGPRAPGSGGASRRG